MQNQFDWRLPTVFSRPSDQRSRFYNTKILRGCSHSPWSCQRLRLCGSSWKPTKHTNVWWFCSWYNGLGENLPGFTLCSNARLVYVSTPCSTTSQFQANYLCCAKRNCLAPVERGNRKVPNTDSYCCTWRKAVKYEKQLGFSNCNEKSSPKSLTVVTLFSIRFRSIWPRHR